MRFLRKKSWQLKHAKAVERMLTKQFCNNYSMNMSDPRISAALSVIMGINLTGDDDKMETEPSEPSPPKPKREPTPPPQKVEEENLTEEQKQVFSRIL